MISIHDRIAIEQRLSHLAWAISQGDRVAFQANFAVGARWHVDGEHLPLAWLNEWMRSPAAPGHQVWTANLLVTALGADRAIARSYLMLPYFGQTVVPATFIMALGTATDELVRAGDDWLLVSRQVAWGAPRGAPGVPRPADPAPSAGALSPEDRLAIADLYADYAWALDTGDGRGCANMFTPEGLLTDPGGQFVGREAIFSFLGGLHARNASFRGRQHWVGSPRIEMDGPGAASVRAFACVPSYHASGAVNLDLIASYYDRLIKADGQWWFAERLITPWIGEPLRLFPRYAPVGDAT